MKTISIILLAIIIILSFIYGPGALRIYRIMHLYDEDKIAHNFINMSELFIASESIKPSSKAKALPRSDNVFILPDSYQFEGKDCKILQFITRSLQKEVLRSVARIYRTRTYGQKESSF